ncbi:MAG: hypothetical protein ACRDEA_18960, partial [Microcystaceae cyanobacterium]
ANQLTATDTIKAANLNFNAVDGVSTGNLDVGSDSGSGGSISVTSSQGKVSTGDLDSSGVSGGNISIKAQQSITTGAINSSAGSNNGGKVVLNANGDIQVAAIDAQGGSSGTGGTVDIATANSFRATNTFTDRNHILASISTAGGQGGGNITIQHGGNGVIPFTVNDVTSNGTVGAITSGDFTIASIQSLQFTQKIGNIEIISVDSPTPPVNPPPVNPPPVSPPPVSPPPVSSPPVENPLSLSLLVDLSQPYNPSESSSVAFLTINPSAPPVSNTGIAKVEQDFTSDYETRLGLLTPSRAVSLEESQLILRRTQQNTEVKSAFIYISFERNPAIAQPQNTDILWTFNSSGQSHFQKQQKLPSDLLKLRLVTANSAVQFQIT